MVLFASMSSRPGRTQGTGRASEVTYSVTRTWRICQRKSQNEVEKKGAMEGMAVTEAREDVLCDSESSMLGTV